MTRVVNYTGDWQGQTLFAMNVNCEADKSYELTLENIKFEKVGGGEQPQPSTPTTPANPEDYQLGAKMNAQFTLQNANKEAYVDRGTTEENKFAVWHTADSSWNCGTVVTMNETKIENNALTISYTGGSVDFSVQLYYNNPSVIEGKQYFLSMKINASELYTITINGVAYTLAAGENNVALVFTKGNSTDAMQALDVQFPGHDTQLTFVISDVAWQEVTASTQPEPPAGATQMTKVGSAAEATEAGKWYYYAKENVTVTKAEVAADGTITFVYSGATAWDDVKIFYTPADVPDGEQRTILLTIKFDYEGEPGALTVSLNDNGNTCPGYGRGQEFTGQGFRFTKNAGSPMFQMTLGKDEVANPQGQVTLTLKVENVAP